MNHTYNNESLSALVAELLDEGVTDPTRYLDVVFSYHYHDLGLLRLTAVELAQRGAWPNAESGIWAMLHGALDVLRGAIPDRDEALATAAALQAAGSLLALEQLVGRSEP